MTMKGETVLTGGEHPGTALEICESGAGFFLGFRDNDGMPYTRESVYFGDYGSAQQVLRMLRGLNE